MTPDDFLFGALIAALAIIQPAAPIVWEGYQKWYRHAQNRVYGYCYAPLPWLWLSVDVLVAFLLAASGTLIARNNDLSTSMDNTHWQSSMWILFFSIFVGWIAAPAFFAGHYIVAGLFWLLRALMEAGVASAISDNDKRGSADTDTNTQLRITNAFLWLAVIWHLVLSVTAFVWTCKMPMSYEGMPQQEGDSMGHTRTGHHASASHSSAAHHNKPSGPLKFGSQV